MTRCWSALGYLPLVVALGCVSIDGAKVLILPAPLYSHCLEVGAIGQELANRGHNVSIFLGSNFKAKDCFSKFISDDKKRIREIRFRSNPDVPPVAEVSSNMSSLVQEEELDTFTNIAAVSHFVRLNCHNLLSDKEAIIGLKKENFDIVVVDGFFLSYCIFVIPYKIGVPYVSASTMFDDFISGRPFLPSTVPSMLSKFTDDMTFVQKLKNVLNGVAVYQLGYWTMPIDVIAEVAPELTTNDVLNLASNSELFLYNGGFVLGYPSPTMPNHIYIGGIATTPAKPLAGTIKDFYNETKTGVILVTFGSSFGFLPQRVETNLIQALKKIETDVLWKYLKEDKDGPILRIKWVPQNDILGHPKTKLFISHCGNNGLYEALYHGVPVLCTPLFGDQLFNAMRVQSWKVGAYINLITSTENELFDAIYEVLHNPLYKENMKMASQMFHSQPLTPRERAAFWIEYVMKFGSKHLRSRGADIPVISYIGGDIMLFVVSVTLVIAFSAIKCVSFCCRKCFKSQKMKTS